MQVVNLGPVVDGMQVINIVPMPHSSFTKDSPIVVEGIMQAAKLQGQSPVKPLPTSLSFPSRHAFRRSAVL